MRGNLAAIFLAAVALVGVQRVPCLLGTATAAFQSDLAAAPPCHMALPPTLAEDPQPPARGSEPAAPCSQCTGVHALVPSGPAAGGASASPAALTHAELPVPAWTQRAHRNLAGLPRVRAPDPFAITTVRLL